MKKIDLKPIAKKKTTKEIVYENLKRSILTGSINKKRNFNGNNVVGNLGNFQNADKGGGS
ncbi:hypothetical protein RWE15_03875 [Virgibacillus halophilus]|uniref:Uncharacterized protein n=1 Tax=Tigheibacillus halophilus TaxID=361280 RepID=A0ABU5C3D7_9BACI|nr:hypothetical protein [Virgibacillus halophilus]